MRSIQSRIDDHAARANLRIVDVQICTINGRPVKRFAAYKLEGDAFVFLRYVNVPVSTPNWALWRAVFEGDQA